MNTGLNISLTEGTTTTVTSTALVSDLDGFGDISSVQDRAYRLGVGAGCALNDNNCYLDTVCTLTSCSGTSCTANCEFNIWFHAEPTVTGTPWSAKY